MRKEIHPISKMSQNPFQARLILRNFDFIPPPNHLFLLQIHIFTACKRSCGEVMYLHMSVILFTGGESLSRGRGVSRGISIQWGLCHGGRAGGTHPAGMHSCFGNF